MVDRQSSSLNIRGSHLDQRVGIFVDVQNMFYGAKTQHRAKLNYRRLLQEVTGDRQLVRAVAYMVTKPEVDQTSFVDALTHLGFETRIKFLKIRPDGSVKGAWHMELALEVAAIAPKLDTVILVTGDGAYAPLLDHLRELGLRCEVVGFEHNTAGELTAACDEFIPITDSMLFKDKKFEARAIERANGDQDGADGNSLAGRFANEAVSAEERADGLWGS